MSSIGVFRQGEIDGKQFHIFNFLSQTDIPTYSSSSSVAAIDSGADAELSLQPLFLCPLTRFEIEMSKQQWNALLTVNTSPHFPNIRSCDQQVQSLFDPDNHSDICKLPLAPLFWCSDKSGDDSHPRYCCKARNKSPETGGNSYYFCVSCDEMFHKECVEAPVEIKHPSYPFLPFQLYISPSNYTNHLGRCIFCSYRVRYMFYHCPTYNLSMHTFCTMKPIPFVIDHPKRHPHPLTLFPNQDSLRCNVCGLITERSPTYVCVQCFFVVHQDCANSPTVIRISRHPHRISFTSSLPSGKWSCGVCRKDVDNNYGAYSCNKCDDYFVHTRCAIEVDLWDEDDLEGVPEEPETGLEPFEVIAEGIILHFSHGHHLKLEISRIYDNDKFCQACVLPLLEGNYYSCMDQCDFILHEKCASSPLEKHHPLHPHPLTLKVVTTEYDNGKGYFHCYACRRNSCGFVYESQVEEGSFRLDLRCASVTEPFEYEGHEHPLFLALTREEEESAICQICKGTSCRKLNCIKCDYVLCFQCATLPYKVRYEDDKHLLTYRNGKEASDRSNWCEVCESEIVYSGKGGFYVCDDYCCTTLHVHCLLGRDMYMKPGQTIKINEKKVCVHRNNIMFRPFCYGSRPEGTCDEGRCPYKVVFEMENKTFCSHNCLIEEV